MTQEIKSYMIEDIYVEFMDLYREYLILRDFDIFYDRNDNIPLEDLLITQVDMLRRLTTRFSQLQNKFFPLLRGD